MISKREKKKKKEGGKRYGRKEGALDHRVVDQKGKGKERACGHFALPTAPRKKKRKERKSITNQFDESVVTRKGESTLLNNNTYL